MDGKRYNVDIWLNLRTGELVKGAAELDKQLSQLTQRENERAKRQRTDELRDYQKFSRDRTHAADQAGRDAANIYEKHLGAGFFRKLGEGATKSFKSAFSLGGLTGGGASGILGAALGVAGGNILTSALSSIGGGIKDFVQTGIDFNDQLERAHIGFRTILGDEAKASDLMKQIVDFGTKTPFKTAELIEYTQKLLAMGFTADQVIPTLKSVGDAAAGLGGSSELIGRITLALGQMKEKGKVSGEEMRQLAEAGINGWEFLAKAANKTVAETQSLAEKGMLNADRAVAEIIKGMEERFPDLMKSVEGTYSAQLSTLEDITQQRAGQIFKPLFEQVKTGQGLAISAMQSGAADAVASGAAGIQTKVGAAFDTAFRKLAHGDFLGYAQDIGTQITAGITTGVQEGAKSAEGAASSMAQGVIDVTKSTLGIKSPSVVFYNLGLLSAQGFQLGLQDGLKHSNQFKEWTDEQSKIARRIIEIGREVGASEKQIRAALEAGITESNLKNLRYGDRDSLGVMQQRPSQGWGSPAQVMNVDYAIRKFFEVLQTVSQSGTPGQMAQRVQQSAYPKRYDQHSREADDLLAQLSGTSGGSLQGNVTNLIQNIGLMSNEAARLASDTGDTLREEIAQRQKSADAFDAAISKANERLTWALRLSESTPGERANKDTLIKGAASDLTVLERDRSRSLGDIDARIKFLQVEMSAIGNFLVGGSNHQQSGTGDQLPIYDERGKFAGWRTLAQDELPVIERSVQNVLAALPPLYNGLGSLHINAMGAMDAINAAGTATADAFGNLPPLINTAAKEAKDSEKEFSRVAQDIAGVFGTGLATALTGNFRGALQGLRSDLFSFTTNWLRDLFTKSIFDAIKGSGSSSSGGTSSGGSSIVNTIAGKIFGGSSSSALTGGYAGGNPAAAILGGSFFKGDTAGSTEIGKALSDAISGGSPLTAPASATTGAPVASTIAKALSSSSLFDGIGFGLKPGSAKGLAAILPMLAATGGSSLVSGLYPQSGGLASLLGGAGGLLIGAGLTAAPAFLSTGVFAAGHALGGLGSFATGLFSNPITVGIGAAILVGSLIYAHSKQRQADEKKRDAISGSTGQQIWQLITQAKAGNLTLSEAKGAWAKIDTDFHQQVAQIRDSKARRNSEKQWSQDFMPLRDLLFQAATEGDAAKTKAAAFSPTFKDGGSVFQRLADGGMMQPFGSALYLGDSPFRGRVPGQYNRKDDRLAWLTGDETVITPLQKLRLGGDDAMARAGVPGYQRRNAFADGGSFAPQSVQTPAPAPAQNTPIRATVMISADMIARLTLEHPSFGKAVGEVAVKAVANDFRRNRESGLIGYMDRVRRQG